MNKKLSAEFCAKNELVILDENEQTVNIGVLNPLSDEIKNRLERYFQPEKTLTITRIERDEFDVLLTRLFSGTTNFFVSSDSKNENSVKDAAKAAPAVNLLNSVISEGIMKNASDIHIDIQENQTRIRYRKDGILLNMLYVEKEKGITITNRIKLLAELNILEHRKCQDGRFDFVKGENVFDIRVSIIPGIEGESSVLRILGGDIKAPELEDLGFDSNQLILLENMLQIKHGLILVTGPTGSGKTTTLASIISRLNKDDIQIITIEDPVEYRIKNVLQISVDEEIGNTFFEILKRILRHDPDVLMVGEIRDEQTAAMACRMALTGHLVFASLHTNSCEETPLRLIDMGVPEYIVRAVLKGVISQRLVPKKGGGRTVKAQLMYFESEKDVKNLCSKIF